MALVKMSQIKGGPELQQDVEALKKAGGSKNLVFVAASIKQGDSTAEILFPYSGKCTQVIAGIGTINNRGEEEGPGEIKVELQAYNDEVWETLVPLVIEADQTSAIRKDLELTINQGPLRVKVTRATDKIIDLSVTATIKVDTTPTN